MSLKDQFQLLSIYNRWMNSKVYAAAGRLSATDLAADRGAFFGSILGTLNHIVVADTIWLKRFASHPSSETSLREIADLPDPTRLDQIVFDDFGRLSNHRGWLDQKIVDWIADLSDRDLDSVLSYRKSKDVAINKRYSSLVLHFFNHQTHHRGQVTTLLSQVGEDVGATDLLVQIPEEADV